MNYRFVKITTFYRNYLKYYYSKNKDITDKSYAEQYDHLMHDSFGWADFYKKNFKKLGVEAHEIIGNAEHLQNTWAKEHNINKTGLDIVFAQIQTIKPDVVFIQDPVSFDSSWVKMLKENIPSIKIIIGSFCSPFNASQLELFKNFDFMITCARYFVDSFMAAGIKTYHLNHAFEESILEKIPSDNSGFNSDLIFIGSLIASNDMHDFRTSVIEKLLNADINFTLHSKLDHDAPLMLLAKKIGYINTKMFRVLGFNKFINTNPYLKKFSLLNELPRNPKYSDKLISKAQEPLFGIEMYKALSESKCTLNIHGGVGDAKFAANMRLFEVTGVGSCLVTDWKENLHELFVPDEEVVTFKTADECIEKVTWLVDNPDERLKIAKAGQKKTLKDHTFEIRVKHLDEIIRKELADL